MRRLTDTLAFVALAFGLVAAAPLGAAAGATADFKPVEFLVTIDGSAAKAEVWQSQIAGEMLILSDDLASPVRLVMREGRVETVQFMKVDRRSDTGLSVLPEASDRQLGKFRMVPGGVGVSFKVDGKSVALREKPALLGRQDLAGMKKYSREYVRLAEEYKPSKAFIDRLRTESRTVRVEVYFGSWCPFCQQMVPRVMRVAEELDGSKIEVAFYGLPRGEEFSRDPKAKELEIKGVPTGVVFVDGKEVGRVQSNDWKIPELRLNSLLVQR